MAVDNRPFKSKEQDGQGNEVIIRDQQLVEQVTTTTMPAGTYFQTLDVDGRPVKIAKDNMLNLIVEGLGIIFSGQSDQQTVTKVPTLNGNNFGASTVATLASVLGGMAPKIVLTDSDDLNTIVTPGLYTQDGAYVPSNMPTSGLNNFFMKVTRFGEGQYVQQELFSKNAQAYYMRMGTVWVDNSITWEDWQRIDNYGTTSLAGLASALGVAYISNEITGDLNLVPSGFGVYYQSDGVIIENMPNRPEDCRGEMQLINLVFGNYGTQIVTCSTTGVIFVRNKRGINVWTPWNVL